MTDDIVSSLRDRPTPDIIVIILTFVVGFAVTVTVMVMVLAVLSGNAQAAKEVFKSVGELTNGLIALIVGYVAGRGAQNGTKK